jgi:FHS family L-fucose permease-like MFS transporter
MQKKASPLAALVIIGAMFFIFGFVTWLNGPLIAFVKLAFRVDDTSAFLVPFAFYISYFVFALPAGMILKRTGMKRGMALGLAVMAVGAALFGQCVASRLLAPSIAALFVIGAGLALLQTASNPYVSIMGPIESAAQRIAFMGICNKGAGILAPLLFGVLVMHDIGGFAGTVAAAPDEAARQALLQAFANRIYAPYMAMAALLAVLAFGVLRSPLPEITDAANPDSLDGGRSRLIDHPNLCLGVVCMFLYVGVEVMAGDAIGTYGAGFGLPLDQTKFFTSFTLAAMLLGYLAGLVLIPRLVSQERYLACSAILGMALTVAATATSGLISVGFVAALGFANAMMFPAIFPVAIRGLGRLTETGSAMMVMAIAGGAVLPQIFVHLKNILPFQDAFLALMLPAYCYILAFGWGEAALARNRAAAGHDMGAGPA